MKSNLEKKSACDCAEERSNSCDCAESRTKSCESAEKFTKSCACGAVVVPELLLPAPGIDPGKWAVVACDQYTSEPDYWEDLDRFVGTSPSTLRCVFPEVWLGNGDGDRIAKIDRTIEAYLDDGVFSSRRGMVLVERVSEGRKRIGLVLAVDLESYSFRHEDHALIRATEGTILSRIPPRVKIREHAKAEFPHIMLLADDRKNEIFGPLYAERENLETIYDFELNGNGGRLHGWLVRDCSKILEAFGNLLNPEMLIEKYGREERMLFAVGDGNHSLATAKTCWENLKAELPEAELCGHPARYALVEVVNIHDEGLRFEPIHRVAKGADRSKFLSGLKGALSLSDGTGKVTVVTDAGTESVSAPSDTAECYRTVQNFLDEYLAENGGEIDYIHGEASLKSVTQACGGVGILMPALGKTDLFSFVIRNGSLPRKTFSMGEANEKRYYFEGRRIDR